MLNTFLAVVQENQLCFLAIITRLVQNMDYSCIVFDTAPTGHTLRLLQFPSTIERGLGKMASFKTKFGGIINQVGSRVFTLFLSLLILKGLRFSSSERDPGQS